MKTSIILHSFRESFALMWKNKLAVALLFAVELVFLASLFYLSVFYQTRILESSKAIDDYVSRLELNDATVVSDILQQKSLLGPDPLSISRNLKDMVWNFRMYLAYLYLIIVIFVSISWALTYSLSSGRKIFSGNKNDFSFFRKNLLKGMAVTCSYFALIFAFFYSLFSISFAEYVEQSRFFAKYIPFVIFSSALAYFLYVSLSSLGMTDLKNIVQKALYLGIRKFHYCIAAFAIGFAVFLAALSSLLYFAEKSVFISLVSIALFVFSFIFGRILAVQIAGKIGKVYGS